MKKLIYIILLIALHSNGQENFYKMVKNVEGTGYHLTDSLYKSKDNIQPYRKDVEQNWINTRIADINRPGQDTLNLYRVDASEIVRIESLYIKSNKSLFNNLYGRAEIQKWTFTTAAEAEKAEAAVAANHAYGDLLNKGGWSYWIDGSNLYFILLPGAYMKGQMRKIEAKLRKK